MGSCGYSNKRSQQAGFDNHNVTLLKSLDLGILLKLEIDTIISSTKNTRHSRLE